MYDTGRCVYVAHALKTELYKIGFASDVNKRFANLSTASPVELRIAQVHYCVTHKHLERALHAYFDDKRHHGEWFVLTTEDIAFLRIPTGELLDCMGIDEEVWIRWRKDLVTLRDISPKEDEVENEELEKPIEIAKKEPGAANEECNIIYPNKIIDRNYLAFLHDEENMSWRAIAALDEFRDKGIPAGSLCSFAGGWEPRTDKARKRFGLPAVEIQDVYRDSLGRYSERS